MTIDAILSLWLLIWLLNYMRVFLRDYMTLLANKKKLLDLSWSIHKISINQQWHTNQHLKTELPFTIQVSLCNGKPATRVMDAGIVPVQY